MRVDLSTPAWAIERHRDRWLMIDRAVSSAFEFYRQHFYSLRPEYSWRHHVSTFHAEVVEQVKSAFTDLHDAELVSFIDRGELFLLRLDDHVVVKFSAAHKAGGHPNTNATDQAEAFIFQHVAFSSSATEGGEQQLLAGYRMDPSWEEPPECTISYYTEGARRWRFIPSDAEMDEALEKYGKAQ